MGRVKPPFFVQVGDDMSLKDVMAADAAIFFNSNEFAEAATYNGVQIDVVPEIGAELQDGNAVEKEGSADRAIFWVKKSDVSSPKAGDVIVFESKTWRVVRLISTDAVMHSVECVGRISPHQLGR